MKSPVCYYLSMASWFLTALLAFDFGLGAFGRGFFLSSNLVQGNLQAFQYLLLASALWSFYGLAMSLQDKKGCRF